MKAANDPYTRPRAAPSPYFEHLRARARRSSALMAGHLWQCYIEELLLRLLSRLRVLSAQIDLKFETAGATCAVRLSGRLLAIGITRTHNGWEECAERLRHNLRTGVLGADLYTLYLIPAGPCATESPAEGVGRGRDTITTAEAPAVPISPETSC